MPRLLAAALAAAILAGAPAPAAAQVDEGFNTMLARAVRYVLAYESDFALLVADEQYVQEIRRPPNPGTNLSRNNPGGGMQANGPVSTVELKSDYVLVQMGDGGGWMPFRDVKEVKGGKVKKHEDDRLEKLFVRRDPDRFEEAMKIMAESSKFNLGPVARTINIPTLAMMFLHPAVNERFRFKDEGEEMVGPRLVRRVSFREEVKPTLIKTSRGRDLPLSGHVWFEQGTGAIVKTDMFAMDPVVQASVTVFFQKDDGESIWLPSRMEEYYKAALSVDEIFATATYSNHRKLQIDPPE